MPEPAQEPRGDSLTSLIGDLAAEGKKWAKAEISLATAELKSGAKTASRSLVAFGIAISLVSIGAGLLAVAAALGVGQLLVLFAGLTPGMAYLIGVSSTGALAILIGTITILVAKSRLKKSGLRMPETRRSLLESKRWAEDKIDS